MWRNTEFPAGAAFACPALPFAHKDGACGGAQCLPQSRWTASFDLAEARAPRPLSNGCCLALARVFGEVFSSRCCWPRVPLAILLAPKTPNPERVLCRREDLLEQKIICAGMMAVVGHRGTGAQECEKQPVCSARVTRLHDPTSAPPGRGSSAARSSWCWWRFPR